MKRSRLYALWVSACMGAAGLAAPWAAWADDKSFIFEEAPAVGTSIKKKVVMGGSVPYEKTYAQLTPQEKASVRSAYNNMPEADEPPYPKYGLTPIYKSLAKFHKYLLQPGDVEMYVTVDSTGAPVNVEVFKAPSPEVGRIFAEVLLKAEYKPAVCGGQPCRMEFPLITTLKVEMR